MNPFVLRKGLRVFIVDYPYASPVLAAWLERTQHPVLENEMAANLVKEGYDLNVVGSDEAARRVAEGERVCTNSENALEWLSQHAQGTALATCIEACKDKELMRTVLAPLDPNLFFKGVEYADLAGVSYEDLPQNVIVKPTVGFCSLGVHAVQCQQDWDNAMKAIDADMSRWSDLYPESVVGASRFIIEEMVQGTEFALDMFYDADGKPHIFNIFQHDFASAEDTSDRLYWCSQGLRDQMTQKLDGWLTDAGKVMGLKDFCVHIELRVDGEDVHVIEFNPLRFAGLGGTDVSMHSCGMTAYDVYLGYQDVPNYVTDERYVMSVLMPDASTPVDATFDYDAFAAHLSHVLELRRFERAKMSAYGFAFLKVANGEAGDVELDWLLNVDLEQFISAS